MSTNSIHFLLNQELIQLTDVDPNLTILQYLREIRAETGTKEGCGSGDCGACTVVLAKISSSSSARLDYHSINACIGFVGMLHGKQLITVEHLKQENQLHPVQQSVVDNHASQCGFCTPGIVMSSFALHKNKQQAILNDVTNSDKPNSEQSNTDKPKSDKPNRKEVVEALAGNLCRCTGYRSIIDASLQVDSKLIDDSFIQHQADTIELLTKINELPSLTFNYSNHTYHAPKSVEELSALLLKSPQSTLVAGGTDLALSVTQELKNIERLIYLGEVKPLTQIRETDEAFYLGSAVSYHQFHSFTKKSYPELYQMIERIGSTQIRNNGTIGGNIANASPIGDMPPVLIALNARLVLQKGNDEREIPIEEFFTGYKTTQLQPSEFLKEIIIPKLKTNQLLKVYKISKRFDDDISTLLCAFFIELEKGTVKSVRIAFGGMAAMPKRAFCCEITLFNQAFSQEIVQLAMEALESDFQPMSDVRASSDYRMLVAKNIIQKFYLELTEQVSKTRVTDHA